MSVCFFHLRHDEGPDEDLMGMSFENVDDARGSAIETLREAIADQLRAALAVDIAGIEITDASGKIVASVGSSEAVIKALSKT